VDKNDITVIKSKPPVLTKYAAMIIKWASESNLGENNWTVFNLNWEGLEKIFKIKAELS
jgi:hypothetical protein